MVLLYAAYRPAKTDHTWLQGLVEAARPLDPGRGVGARRFDLRGRPRLSRHVGDEIVVPPEDADRLVKGHCPQVRRLLAMGPLVRLSHAVTSLRRADVEATWRRLAQESGTHDAHGVVGMDRGCDGVALMLAAPDRRPLPPRTSHMLTLVARHLGLGARLRRIGFRFDAVVDDAGRVAHAEGRARDKGARDALQRAARRRARTPGSSVEALDLWREVVDGRWLLVQRHESDGRRYLLACRCAEEPPRLGWLTATERAVATRAAGGAPNKQIAFELDLLPSVVAQHLATALRKLGLGSRRELIVLHGTDGQDDGTPPG
jgi:DNA-binding CsgD family transcriptional regulator